MSTNKLFDEDSEEEEVSFKTENEYAKKYDNWREKEELHKLEQKYGTKALADDISLSDSEDDDDEPPEVSEEVETQFLKTLALLKTKDPRIYEPDFKAFVESEEKKEEKLPPQKPLVFEDSDSDSGDDGNIFKVEKKAEIDVVAENKSADSKKPGKEAKIKDFLIGKAEHIDDEVEKDLAPLKALWSDPKLNEGEAFLRDYILNKRYLEEGDAGDAEDRIRDDEDLEEDEKRVEEQNKFERAYNFRFEEPDDEFLKRYPRTMNYTRPKDDRRSKKRAEVRSRKEEEKRRKMEEIARLKALKLKEIQEKIAKIKEVTGNKDLAFKEDDIEGDFDPEEHDRRMKAVFDEEFYGEVDDQKPVFPDLDEELEIENWDKYDPDCDRAAREVHNYNEDEPHCEDDDFNMDADYDPKQAKARMIEEIQSTLGKKRRNRKKKSKLAELLISEKPKFVPAPDKTYNEYMEEYYKMDCEDVIGGDLPTRFKYREVVPNDYGLTIEEILLADDKELTQWVPLKKIVKHRPRDVEKNEVHTYRQRAADERVKKKILPSLFKDLPEEPEVVVPLGETIKKKKKKKKSKDRKEKETEDSQENEVNSIENGELNGLTEDADVKIKKKKRKHKETNESANEVVAEEDIEVSPKKDKKKHKHKEDNLNLKGDEDDNVKIVNKVNKDLETVTEEKEVKHNKKVKVTDEIVTSFNENETNTQQANDNNKSNSQVTELSKNKKKKNKSNGFVVENIKKLDPSQPGLVRDSKSAQEHKQKGNLKRKFQQSDKVPNKKKKFNPPKNNDKEKHKFKQNKNKQSSSQSDHPLNKLSDERLKAYGLNPKKYRSFLKYKKF